MQIFEKFPLEKYIFSLMKKYDYDIESISDDVFNKYPFVKKDKLKKVVAFLVHKKINGYKISGRWLEIKNLKEMVDGKLKKAKNNFIMVHAKSYNDLAHDKPPLWDAAPIPQDLGKGNRYQIVPEGMDPDRYEPPKIDESQKIYEKLKTKFKTELPGIEEDELHKIIIDEMRDLGYEQNLLEKIRK